MEAAYEKEDNDCAGHSFDSGCRCNCCNQIRRLSGMWGDVWFLDAEEDKKITLYYDANGRVENVRMEH